MSQDPRPAADVNVTANAETANSTNAATRRIDMPWMAATGAVWFAGLLLACFFWFVWNRGVHGVDSIAYWRASHFGHIYRHAPGEHNAYLYSPAFVTAIWPLGHLPARVFIDLWMVAEAAAFVWLLKPLGGRWGVFWFGACTLEIAIGNIYAFFAVVAVLGFARPGLWSLPLLTKITPGLGPIWFAARGEWRALRTAVMATLAIALVSFAIVPHEWSAWLHFLVAHQGGSQLFLPIRTAAAVALTVYAARTDRRYLIAVAMLLANPMVYRSEMALTVLAAIPRLRELDRAERSTLQTDRDRAVDGAGNTLATSSGSASTALARRLSTRSDPSQK